MKVFEKKFTSLFFIDEMVKENENNQFEKVSQPLNSLKIYGKLMKYVYWSLINIKTRFVRNERKIGSSHVK